jgi:hydroxymethylpyrimidine/phosphomethylpyrimidine kinase
MLALILIGVPRSLFIGFTAASIGLVVGILLGFSAGYIGGRVDDLVRLATVVTPNLDEAAILVGSPVDSVAEMEVAGKQLVAMGSQAALIKGGHLARDVLVDVLVTGEEIEHFEHERIETTSTHGTGCTLSSAIVAGLALGKPLRTAVGEALEFVHRAIATAPGLGAGHGPLNHFAQPRRQG